jgi:Uncharacterized protein conserved in bacteria (DUF2272)
MSNPGIAGLLLGLFALSACVEHPVPIRVDGPAIWRNSVAVAEGEWQRFGGQVVHIREEDGAEVRAIDPVRLWEDDYKAYEPLREYWSVVDIDDFDSWSDCYSDFGKRCPWQLPWSAVFISYVLVQAGAPPSVFEPDAEHWDYLRFLIRRSKQPGAVFEPRTIDGYRPAPGDIICKTRAGADAPDAMALIAEPDAFGGSLPMHCDFVLANHGADAEPDGMIEGIGGNVLNSVSKSLIPADRGRLVNGRAGKWFIILRNRYGTGAASS